MSHYLVAVLVSNEEPVRDVMYHVENTLAPFDESLEVAPYVRWNKDILIQEQELSFEKIKANILTYAYEQSEATSEEEAIQWFYQNTPFKQDPRPMTLCYRDVVYEAISDYLPNLPTGEALWDIISDPENFFYASIIDQLEDGVYYSEYNPNSKWDWYSIGGRWEDLIVEEAVANPDFYRANGFTTLNELNVPLETFTYALVDLDGNWREPGEMGWFGCSSSTPESKEAHRASIREYLDTLSPDTWVCFVDCHI